MKLRANASTGSPSIRAADVIARAQRLVDAPPKRPYPLGAYVEAEQVGDLPAVVALLLREQPLPARTRHGAS